MLIKKIGRQMLESLVKRFNYKLVYVHPISSNVAAERVIFQAYCRGKCFYCYKGTVVGDYMLSGKGWDTQMNSMLTDCLRENRSPRPCVIEVGANIGASLIPVCSDFPDVTFHMIEPVPDFFALLEKNRGSFSAANVKLYNVAASDEDSGDVIIQCDLGNAGRIVVDGLAVGEVAVKSRTLDSMFPDLDVVFLKIDVDGYELDVLKGAVGMLSKYKPQVFLEFHQAIMSALSINPAEILEILVGCGLDRFDVYANTGALLARSADFRKVLKCSGEIEQSGAIRPYLDLLAKAR